MTRKEMIDLIQPWINRGKAVEAIVDDAKRLLGADPASPIIRELLATFAAFTAMVAKIIGDEDEWLQWFLLECHLGKTPKVMRFGDGEELLVVGASDLAAAIDTDEHGNRTWEGGAA